MRLGEWDAHGKTTTEILHVVQNDGLGVGKNSVGLGRFSRGVLGDMILQTTYVPRVPHPSRLLSNLDAAADGFFRNLLAGSDVLQEADDRLDAPMEVGEEKLLIGRMEVVVGQAKAHQDARNAQLADEVADNRNGAAAASRSFSLPISIAASSRSSASWRTSEPARRLRKKPSAAASRLLRNRDGWGTCGT